MTDYAQAFLVINGRGHMRLAKRSPRLGWDEVAFPISVQIPPGWGRVYTERAVTLVLPEPPDNLTAEVGDPLEVQMADGVFV